MKVVITTVLTGVVLQMLAKAFSLFTGIDGILCGFIAGVFTLILVAWINE